MTEYCLRPWAESNTYGHEILRLIIRPDGLDVRTASRNKAITSGIYIHYPEGVFGVFVDEMENVYLLMKGSIFPLSEVTAMTLRTRLIERELTFYFEDQRRVRYQYLSLWRVLFRPSILLDMIFLDMWELQFDLPSWMAECYQKGDEGIVFMKNVCLGNEI